MADDMRAGRFVVTHQAIAFDAKGNLIDGQHRLRAVIMSGVTVTMQVAFDCEIGVGAPIDIGIRRSTSFILGKSSAWVTAMGALRSLEMCELTVKGTVLPGTASEAYSHNPCSSALQDHD